VTTASCSPDGDTLAECALRSGDPEHAVHLAHKAIDTAAGQYVRSVVDRAQALHGQFVRLPDRAPAVGYGERLRELPTSRPAQKER
jgi:hypothetical protein